MGVIKTTTYWLFVICIPLLLLTSTIHLGVNSTHLYEYGFDRYDVSEDTGIDREQLSNVAKRLVEYFNFKVETPQMVVVIEGGEEIPLFQENEQNRELTHLADVRRLFQFNHRVQVASLAYIIIYVLLPSLIVILRERSDRRISLRTGFLLWKKGRWQDLAKGITHGCALTLAIIAMLGIASILINFEQLFLQFHHVAFDNPWWVSSGYLPKLFPEQFWQDIAFLGGGTIAVEALLFGGIAWAVPFVHQRRKR